MPSQKPSMIDALRAKHDPHYQLAGKVESLEKGLPIQIAQLHKTMSKSFGMQRKTLTRVLGLEGRLSNLEFAVEAWTTREGIRRQKELEELEEQIEELEEEFEDLGEEIPAGLDELIDDVRGDKGGTKAKPKAKAKPKTKPKAKAKPKTKPKAKAKPKVKPKAKKTRVTGKKINKPKIDADKFKKGTSQETVEERLKRQAKNREETAAAEEHKKSDEFTETTTGTDPKTGEPLSSEERKKRFKAAKFMNRTGLDPQDIKPETEAEIGDDSKKDKIVTFLNGDVKDNLGDVRDDLKQIEGLLKDQNKSADEQYEEMRQGILTAKKKKREEDLEGKDKKPGGGGLKDKMLDMITKPAGNFFNKIIKFITFTFLGSVVNRILGILKDPAQLLDPIKKFFNAIIGMVNAVMKNLWDVTGAPMNFIIGGINDGVKFIIDGINSVSGALKLPAIPAFSIPLVPGPPEVPEIPLSKTAQAQNQEAVGMAGGGLVPGYNEGGKVQTMSEKLGHTRGVVTDPEERKQQEAYMLKFVNEERAFQGLPPLTNLTYAPGVELTKMIGPGPRTKETSDTHMDFDRGIKTTSTSKTVDGKTTIGGSISRTTEEDKQKFFAANPHAAQLVQIKDQAELDNLGADISASAKMNGGGLVQPKRFNKGGKVPGQGEGDTVPAMLTPGEFVMSKGAVNMIGADKLMAMNKAGGGTNVPKMMKFAGGGIVPGIDAPSGKNRKVVVIGGGGGAQAPSQAASSGDSGDGSRRFSSTDPNNMTIPVIKSLYNMMG